MTHTLSDTLLQQLSEFVAEQMGLNFPRERWSDLQRGMLSALRESDLKDPESLMQSFLSQSLTKTQMEVLVSHLTVGETYFFREPETFQILKEEILPELMRSRWQNGKSLRIWSAGCSTGEEPYAIALLLTEMIPDLQNWNLTLLATDINTGSLRKAAEGSYTEWSFRGTEESIKKKYFKRKAGRYEILPSIKRLVTFSYLNLAADTYPSVLNNTNSMDIIFCRNVLMYFRPEWMKKVIQKLNLSLAEDGWLIVSPYEVSTDLFSQFTAISLLGRTLYKKEEATRKLKDASFKVQVPSDKFQEASFKMQDVGSKWKKPPIPETRPLPSDIYEEALSLYRQGCYGEALDKIRALLSQNHRHVKAIALMSRTLANQGKLSEALQWCERAIAADKLNPRFHYLLATIEQERGQIEEAISALKRTLYLNQNFVMAHVGLGRLAQRQGKTHESQRCFRNALSLLRASDQEEIPPEAEGMTAGRLIEIIQTTQGMMKVKGER
jgi:chemotaxis protein methyltransferase CheR